MTTPKYPKIKVRLSGHDGNIFAIGGRIGNAMRDKGVPADEIKAFYSEITHSHSYTEALCVCADWVQTS